jgi:hypothetical protein
VLLVGLMARAASFTHVHDWTLTNSPAGTPDWFGWANAVISELIPTASLIEIGRRRRKQASARYPMVLLVAAVGVSLTAQLAVARPTAFGWMASALPALAFFALSKLVFTATAPTPPMNPVTAPLPAISPAPSLDTAPAKVSPAAVRKTMATPAKKTAPAKKTTLARTPAKKTTAPTPTEPIPAAPTTVDTTATVALADKRFPDLLLSNARTIAASHHDEHGEDINPNQMAVRLKVAVDTHPVGLRAADGHTEASSALVLTQPAARRGRCVPGREGRYVGAERDAGPRTGGLPEKRRLRQAAHAYGERVPSQPAGLRRPAVPAQ